MKQNDFKLHIDQDNTVRHSSFTTYLVEGLSPKEMDSILNAPSWDEKRNRVVELLNYYENDYQPGHTLGDCWGCGYGIYGIRHFGGCLLVDIGNSCD